MKYLIYLIFMGVVISSCTLGRQLPKSPDVQLAVHIEDSDVFNRSFTGFVLYDPVSGKTLYNKNGNKYFTPASNTKILTLYVSTQLLGDKVPALYYIEKTDTLLIWGTGSPALFYDDLPYSKAIYNFLYQHQDKKILLSTNHFQDKYLGAGWAWDDYNDYYSVERSSMPIYGNTVEIDMNDLSVKPSFFKAYFETDTTLRRDYAYVRRDIHGNRLVYNGKQARRANDKQIVPFHLSDSLICELLSDTLKYAVQLGDAVLADYNNKRIRYDMPTDSVYKQLMQVSDNFIAEQLLLLNSGLLFDTLNVDKIIRYAKKQYLKDSPDEFVWRDGSGLSRYNLLTPRSIVFVLDKIYVENGWEWICDIFPAGGVSGTIKNWYASPSSRPYIYAKTGTLSNKHCLSGYIKTKKGKVLIFSFMHNNYVNGSSSIKLEMEKVLEFIYSAY